MRHSKKASRHQPELPSIAEPDLFSTAPANEDGYAQWRADQASEKHTARVGSLHVTADAEGYAAHQAEKARHRAKVEKHFGICLNKPVRVQLRNEPGPREGLLFIADELPNAPRTQSIRLRIGTHSFTFGEIESLVAV